MKLEAAVLGVVEEIYSAAEDEKRWTSVLERVAEALGCDLTGLYVHDLARGRASISAGYNCDASFVASYEQYYAGVDPWSERANRLGLFRSGELLSSDMVLVPSDLRKTEYYADWLAPQRLERAVNVCISKEKTLVANMVVMRGRHRPEFGGDDLRFLSIMTPHLQRAVRLHQHFTSLGVVQNCLADVVNGLSAGVIFVNAGGSIIYVNREGERIAEMNDGLSIEKGRLEFASSHSTRRFRELLASAAAQRRGAVDTAGGALRVERTSGLKAFQVLVSPVSRSTALVAGGAPVVAVFITDPEMSSQIEAPRLRQAFGLTQAEALIAVQIGWGRSPKQIAGTLQLSLNTVRTHLKSIYVKTNTHRQAALVQCLTDVRSLSKRIE